MLREYERRRFLSPNATEFGQSDLPRSNVTVRKVGMSVNVTERQTALSSHKQSKLFLLSNWSDARKSIKADNFGLHYDDYFSKLKDEQRDRQRTKEGMLDGDFKPAFLNARVRGVARSNEDSFLST
jgi:hypothetical protein